MYIYTHTHIYNIYIYIYISFYYFIGSKAPCALRHLRFLYKSNKSLSKSQFNLTIHLDFLNHNTALLFELTEH